MEILNDDQARDFKILLVSLAGTSQKSANSSSNPHYMIFFHSFLKSSTILDYRWRVKVTPKAWALAYLQINLDEIAATLSQFVFDTEELAKRDRLVSLGLVKEALSCFPDYKVNAVRNASYWLKTKNKDPWSYTAPVNDFNIPEEDLGQIENGLLKFQMVLDNGPFLLDSLFGEVQSKDSSESEANRADLQVKVLSYLPTVLTQLCSHEDQLIVKKDLSLHDEVFGTIEALMLLGQADTVMKRLTSENLQIRTSADVLRALSTIVFSHREDFTDSFFDAMQVPQIDLSIVDKRRIEGFGNCVRSLFRMQYRRYCSYEAGSDPQRDGSRFTEILQDSAAAVLILSSIRCVAWIQKNFHPDEKLNRAKIQQTFNPTDIQLPDSAIAETFRELQNTCKQANFCLLALQKVTDATCVHPPAQMDVDEYQPSQQEQYNSLGSSTAISQSLVPLSPASSSNCSTYSAIMTMIRDDLSLDDDKEDKRALIRVKFICDSVGQAMSVALMDFAHVEFSIKLASEALLALQTASGRKDPEFEAGKILFIGLFTPYEIYHGSLSGRRREGTGEKTLGFFTSPELKTRSRALLEMVKFLRSISTRVSISDLLMPKSKLMCAQRKEISNEETLKRKIFVEYRKQRAKDMTPFIKNNITVSM